MLDLRVKNLIKYVVPTTLSSVCFFLFTIIDGIFVGHGVGTNGLGAMNLALPFVMVVNAVFMITTIGGVTITAIRLGREDIAGANQAFMHAITGSFIATIILAVIGVFFTEPLVILLGANQTFHDLAKEYLFWYSLFIIPSGMSVILQGFCRNDGSPILVSAAVITSTIFNIFGDWLFVFPFHMGMKGAALATGISQTIALFIVLTHFLLKKGTLRFHRSKLESAVFRKILLRGLPEGISQLSTPVMTLCMNLVLAREIGDIGVNAFSIISYVASFSVAIFFGTSEGLQPLIGQSYGQENQKDMKFYFHMGLIINFVGSIFINFLLLFIGGNICKLFGANAETLNFTVQSMPLFSWGFTIMSLNVMISMYLYSTKRSKQAIIINILRSLILNSLVILCLPMFFKQESIIWFTFGIYEILVFIIAVILLRQSEKTRSNQSYNY